MCVTVCMDINQLFKLHHRKHFHEKGLSSEMPPTEAIHGGHSNRKMRLHKGKHSDMCQQRFSVSDVKVSEDAYTSMLQKINQSKLQETHTAISHLAKSAVCNVGCFHSLELPVSQWPIIPKAKPDFILAKMGHGNMSICSFAVSLHLVPI